MKKQNSRHEKKNFRLSLFDCDGLLKSRSDKRVVDEAELSKAGFQDDEINQLIAKNVISQP
jgi:hypothetical protein